MDTKQLQEIKARADAATPGPWELYDNAGGVEVNDGNGTYFSVGNDADAEFVAHARTDIPALVAEVERLQKLCEEKEQLIERLANQSRQLNDSNATKNHQITTLEKALGLACERIAEYAFCGGTESMKSKHAEKNFQHFIRQAQEQEGNHE